MKNEKDVKKRVRQIFVKYDWFFFMPPSNAFGKSGISDFIALKHGAFAAVETKFGSNKPTALQVGFLNSIRAEDGFGFVVNDKNIEFLDQFFESFQIAVAAQSRGEPVPPEHGSRMLNCIHVLTRW